MFDKIIFVSADKKTRLDRLIKRNNLDYNEALIRINAQEDEGNKIKKSDFLITNNGNIEFLNNTVENILENLNI
jgi:dephospho-CoA kinase